MPPSGSPLDPTPPGGPGFPAQTVPDYIALVALIRAEMDLALRPVRDDIRDLKETQYSKEALDGKFSVYELRLARLEVGWAALLTRVAAILSLVWVFLNIIGVHLHVF